MVRHLLNGSQGYILTCRAVLLYRCAISLPMVFYGLYRENMKPCDRVIYWSVCGVLCSLYRFIYCLVLLRCDPLYCVRSGVAFPVCQGVQLIRIYINMQNINK